MRTPLPLGTLLFAALGAASVIHAQISNPIPAPIVKRGLAVEIREVVRLPDTRGLRPADQDVAPAGWARVSYVRDLPDGRRFANDSRGFLYLLDSQQPALGVRERRRRLSVAPSTTGWRAGSSGSTFTRSSRATACSTRCTPSARWAIRRRPNFIPPGFTAEGRDLPQHHHRVARHESGREHVRRAPGASCCASAHVVTNLTHPFGAVEFNPTAKPGDPDYGLLYTSGSDHGVQQRRRTEREQSQPDAAPRHGHRRHPAHRPAQSVGVRRDEGPRGLHDSARSTSSPPTAIRRRSARSTPTDSATRTGCHGISPTGRCSRPTSG